VLAGSFARHHPGESLRVLIVDDVAGRVAVDPEPFRTITTDDIGIAREELHRMVMLMGRRITIALRPWLLDHLLGLQGGPAICIDSHVMVCDSLSPVGEAVPADGVLLVPHVLEPLPRDGLDPDETAILGFGMFSSGIYGVGPADGGFIRFLKERLRRECLVDIPHMRVLDQRWLDFVPSFFRYHVERDFGVDVAYWNLHERPLTRSDGRILAGGTPLRSFNFSGFDPRLEGMIGSSEATRAPRVIGSADPVLAEMCEEYRRELIAAGFDDLHWAPFGFDSLPGGVPIYDSLRSIYSDALMEAEDAHTRLPPDPFDAVGTRDFRAWCKDAYARAGLQLPVQLRDTPRSAVPMLPAGGWRSRFQRRAGRAGPDAIPSASSTSQVGPTVDHLASLQAGPAGRWDRLEVQVDPFGEGVVAFGPLGRLDPGCYQVTLELAPGPRQLGRSDLDQALVVEVRTEGYLLGGRAVTFGEMETGKVCADFSIPRGLLREALTAGTEVGVRSRGQVTGSLGAVLVERVGTAKPGLPARSDWLPTMDAGEAGRRAGTEVNTLHYRRGLVVSGPYWRLQPGRYRALLRTRFAPDAAVETSSELENADVVAVVAVVDTVEGETILAEVHLSRRDLFGGSTELSFEIARDHDEPGARVGLRVRTETGIAAVIESVTVERTG
jgi:hypothetical protein